MNSKKQAEMMRVWRQEAAQRHYQQMLYVAQCWFHDRMADIEGLYLKELLLQPIIIKTKWGVLFG